MKKDGKINPSALGSGPRSLAKGTTEKTASGVVEVLDPSLEKNRQSFKDVCGN